VVIHILSNSFVDARITCCKLPAFQQAQAPFARDRRPV
jgi:hypothetical protein